MTMTQQRIRTRRGSKSWCYGPLALRKECHGRQNPSSMFYCSLAMSKSYRLVPLLSKEENLVPNIFSMLSVPLASKPILSWILKFTKNLLTLDEVLDGQDVTVKRVLLIGSLKFYNIVHLQKHRRATALARFSNFVSSVYLFKAITYKVFVPLLFSMLFNARDGNDESIRSACVNALGSIWLHDVGPVQCLASQMFPIFVTKLDDQKP